MDQVCGRQRLRSRGLAFGRPRTRVDQSGRARIGDLGTLGFLQALAGLAQLPLEEATGIGRGVELALDVADDEAVGKAVGDLRRQLAIGARERDRHDPRVDRKLDVEILLERVDDLLATRLDEIIRPARLGRGLDVHLLEEVVVPVEPARFRDLACQRAALDHVDLGLEKPVAVEDRFTRFDIGTRQDLCCLLVDLDERVGPKDRRAQERDQQAEQHRHDDRDEQLDAVAIGCRPYGAQIDRTLGLVRHVVEERRIRIRETRKAGGYTIHARSGRTRIFDDETTVSVSAE